MLATHAAEISVKRVRLQALRTGAVYWPQQETLIVSDLHLEKGSNFAERGVLLPPYDSRTTLRRIAAHVAELKPARVISLGDAFHDERAEWRMDDGDAALLQTLCASTRWIWIVGNHDPAPPTRFPGAVETALALGELTFRHEPSAAPAPGEVAGHLHPAARVRLESGTVRRRCFASDGTRLVLPAFGAYAGGLNVLDAAFSPLFDDLTCWVMGGSGVYPFSREALIPDRRSPGGEGAWLRA